VQFRESAQRDGATPGTPRHEDRFSVRLRADESSPFELCELRNVSTGGMAVLFPGELSLPGGASVLIEFPLGRSASRVQSRCLVRGQSLAADGTTVHLQFLDTSPVFIETLRSCIASWESRPGEPTPS
jgi:hypothetical protein